VGRGLPDVLLNENSESHWFVKKFSDQTSVSIILSDRDKIKVDL